MQFRHVDLVSIGPPSSEVLIKSHFCPISHCYYNVFFDFLNCTNAGVPLLFWNPFFFLSHPSSQKGPSMCKSLFTGMFSYSYSENRPMAQNLTFLSILKFMIGQHRDHSKWLLPPYNTKLCGFWRKGSHYWGCGKRGTEYTGPPISRELSIFLAVTQVESTFYGFKRLLGRKAGDPRITEEMGGRYG